MIVDKVWKLYPTSSLVLSFMNSCMRSLSEDDPSKQTWLDTGNVCREFRTASMDFDVASVEGKGQLQAYMQVQQVSNDTDPLCGGSSISKSFPTCPEWLDST